MLSDFRFAFRTLARNRSFTLVTVLTLALGIGSAASIFSVTDWILFRASKFPDDVYLIGGHDDQNPFMPIRFDFMTRAYEQSNVMSAYSKAAYMSGNVVIGGQPVATSWLGVSANFFPLLGIAPVLGRGFLPGEDKEGSDHVVVVSHQFWQRQLGGVADALGRKITVGDAICTVVGVLREAQTMPVYFWGDIYRPLTYRVDPVQFWLPQLFLLGQLRPGVTREQAQQALQAVKVDVPAAAGQYYAKDRAALSSLAELSKFMRVEIYWVMLGAVGFLYAIACLNASNLMLVRMLGQRRELSIRLALGGGRWRIIRLLAVESVTLAVLAALAGLLVANWFFPLLLSAAGSSSLVARDWTSWTLGWRVVGVMGLLTVTTSLLIVVIPAFRILRTDISSGLKDGGGALGESPALARLRGSFVVLQAAFAVILLAGAGLMIRTFHQLQKVDLGFDPTGRAKVQIGLPPIYTKPADWEPCLMRLREIQAELMRVPGIRAVGFGNDVLLSGFYFASHTLVGPEGRPVKAAMLGFNIGFHEASGLKLKGGRWLNQSRGNEILVNESLARALWPGKDPVGQFVRTVEANPNAPAGWTGWLVVGVVADVRATMREAPGNYIYSPEGWGVANLTTFVVRLSRDYDETFASSIRRDLYKFDPRIVVYQILPLSQARDNQLWAERMADSVLKVLAGIALLLTVVGIFSVLAYTVDRRMGEFGVRMALGATRRDLVDLVMRRGVLLTLLGILLGLGGSLALTRYIQSLLFETSAQDPWVLAAVGGLLLLTSVLACVLPAQRATRVDISKLLRSE
jgi:putative ABC transport system permease protein